MISSFIEKSYIELPLNAFGVNIEVRTSRDISNGYWNIYVRYPSFFCKYPSRSEKLLPVRPCNYLMFVIFITTAVYIKKFAKGKIYAPKE